MRCVLSRPPPANRSQETKDLVIDFNECAGRRRNLDRVEKKFRGVLLSVRGLLSNSKNAKELISEAQNLDGSNEEKGPEQDLNFKKRN